MIKAPALFHLCFGLWAQADSPAGPAVPQFPRLPLIMWQAAGPLEVLGVFGGFWVFKEKIGFYNRAPFKGFRV